MNTDLLFAWLPRGHRWPLLQRLLIVWAMSLPIALATWMGHSNDGPPHRFDVSLVYAYAISTFIWLFTDVARFVFKDFLRAEAPLYWPPPLYAVLMLLVGIPLGYVLGTLVGDAYAGWSTWGLWRFNRSRFAGLAVTSVAISAAYVAFFYQRAKAQSLAQQVTQSQLMLLQSQLEPHMLFNTLAHLRALIGHDTERAHAMLDHLDGYLRTTLQASRQPLHPLADEFARLSDYLHLMAIRMGPRLVFDLALPPALATEPVPSFILQPLVENAIRHGLEPRVLGGSVSISAQADDKQLVLTVRDNGAGISELALSDSVQQAQSPGTERQARSWGLSHVRQRLQTLYGERASLHITPVASGGTCVVLRWPLSTIQ
jgi:signal transduction histidine kinase